MKSYIIKTHGCKSNQLESAVIKEKLDNNGYVQATDPKKADIFILNSCSVTENADNEALRTVRHAKNINPSVITVLTGCSAQLHASELLKLPYVDIVLGNNDKFNIIESLNVCKSEVTDIFKVNDFNNQTIHNYSKTRGYLKIQDGCNNYCSYCTIPLARGKSRSNDIKNIIEQINIYSQIGIKEVVLTGIHIGQWGEDFSPSKQLYHLLSEIENTKILRYRLGSLNPLELNDELLQFLSKSDKFCQHFHLSLQSLTDSTLKSMNRHYTAKDCLILMEKINNIFSLPFIGSDIIVGFPGETEEDFETTLNNAKSSKLSNIHVFPYSLRSNTKAANLPNHVSSAEKQRRAALLQSVARDKYSSFIEQNIGTTAQVLIEKRPDKKTGLLKGVTKNYLNVYIDSTDTSLHNTIANVKILNKEKADSRLICKLV